MATAKKKSQHPVTDSPTLLAYLLMFIGVGSLVGGISLNSSKHWALASGIYATISFFGCGLALLRSPSTAFSFKVLNFLRLLIVIDAVLVIVVFGTNYAISAILSHLFLILVCSNAQKKLIA